MVKFNPEAMRLAETQAKYKYDGVHFKTGRDSEVVVATERLGRLGKVLMFIKLLFPKWRNKYTKLNVKGDWFRRDVYVKTSDLASGILDGKEPADITSIRERLASLTQTQQEQLWPEETAKEMATMMIWRRGWEVEPEFEAPIWKLKIQRAAISEPMTLPLDQEVVENFQLLQNTIGGVPIQFKYIEPQEGEKGEWELSWTNSDKDIVAKRIPLDIEEKALYTHLKEWAETDLDLVKIIATADEPFIPDFPGQEVYALLKTALQQAIKAQDKPLITQLQQRFGNIKQASSRRKGTEHIITNLALEKVSARGRSWEEGGWFRRAGTYVSQAIGRCLLDERVDPTHQKILTDVDRLINGALDLEHGFRWDSDRKKLDPKALLKDCRDLKEGKDLLIKIGASGHAMLARVEKVDPENYRITIYNTGDGIDGNHEKSETGRYQTFAEYEVSDSSLTYAIDQFLKVPDRADEHYERLHRWGKKLPPREGEEFYQTPQQSGSCFAHVQMALFRERCLAAYPDNPAQGLAVYKALRGRLIVNLTKVVDEQGALGKGEVRRALDQKLQQIGLAEKLSRELIDPATKDTLVAALEQCIEETKITFTDRAQQIESLEQRIRAAKQVGDNPDKAIQWINDEIERVTARKKTLELQSQKMEGPHEFKRVGLKNQIRDLQIRLTWLSRDQDRPAAAVRFELGELESQLKKLQDTNTPQVHLTRQITKLTQDADDGKPMALGLWAHRVVGLLTDLGIVPPEPDTLRDLVELRIQRH